jgi:chemotaxis protein CheZ
MVEENLVYLIKLAGRKVVALAQQPDTEMTAKAESIKAQGPQVPGTESGGAVVSGQDEVDDLLSSLGF